MPRVNYVNYAEKARRELLLNDLIRFAEKIREEWPQAASIIYGIELAAKMNVLRDAAAVMARFSKTLIDENRKAEVEPELQIIQLLILRGDEAVAVEDTNK